MIVKKAGKSSIVNQYIRIAVLRMGKEVATLTLTVNIF